MAADDYSRRREWERLERTEREARQIDLLNGLLAAIVPSNPLYSAKFRAHAPRLRTIEELGALPFTTKDELLAADGFASNRTFPLERYVRFHRTSGTRGKPLAVVDTADDWSWWIQGWQFVLDAAGAEPGDRAVLAFSFGPFIGFWSAYDACAARGMMVVPTGGMDTESRLALIRDLRPACVLCTPSYALRMAEVAAARSVPLAESAVRRIIVAGEPGGSLPGVRRRIESVWGAEVIDHAGATEVGPWGYADAARRGLHVNESRFIAEFIEPGGERAAGGGEPAELVLTTLGRTGCPVIRYRTGDLVRPEYPTGGPNRFVLLQGGVLGRVDDMMIVRGVNLFPSSVESILREVPEIEEYRITAFRVREMDELRIEVEDRSDEPDRIARLLRLRLGLRIEVVAVPLGALPRFEGKGRRFVDARPRDPAPKRSGGP
ncbi:MAG: phenylacetate--CoA ligase [Planctomycetes bacterium]|nr:phenylacetate--CoA ligase [Planctomycetota bacterium]